MREKQQQVSVRSTESVISLGKSKRLTAMRKSVENRNDQGILQNKSLLNGNKEEMQLQQVRETIRQSIAKIKATYRQGMQNKLFALRYGSDEEINQMTLKRLFALLDINQSLARELAPKKYKSREGRS